MSSDGAGSTPRFVALSFGSRCSPDERRALRDRAVRAVSPGDERDSEVRTLERDSLVIATAGSAPLETSDGHALVVPTVMPTSASSRRALTGEEMIDAFDRSMPRALEDLQPPFAALFVEPGGRAHGLVDSSGLQHLYVGRSAVAAGVAGSAGVLARVFDAELDPTAWWGLCRVGNYLDDLTAYGGVSKIPAGRSVALSGGEASERVQIERGPFPPLPDPESATAHGRRLVQDFVDLALDAEPDCGIELSGGLDSRLMLAAVGRARSRGRYALTLGYPADEDMAIAARLAGELDMDHQTVDLSGLDSLEGEELLALLRRASAACDHACNVFGRGVLSWVASRTDATPRLSGQNGELIRGFYYAGQRDSREFGRSRVETLARWRVFANQTIDPSIVVPSFREDAERQLLDRLVAAFPTEAGSWLRATDEFYLTQRMQRWVGTEYSAESAERVIYPPFLTRPFVAFGLAVPPAWKRQDSLAVRMLESLSPELAQVKMPGGLRPRDLARRDIRTRLALGRSFVRKAVRKVSQRIGSATRAPVGAERLCRSLVEEIDPRTLLSRVSELPWIDSDALEARLIRGDAGLWTSLGYLLAAEWALEELEGA